MVPFFAMATSQSPSLLGTLATAYNPGMHLLVLPVIYCIENSFGILCNKKHYRAGCACRANGNLAAMQPRASAGSRLREPFLLHRKSYDS